MKDKKIHSVDELVDSRAVALAIKHRIRPVEIIPGYLELARQVASSGKLEMGLDEPRHILNEKIKQIVCGAILCYELSHRQVVILPSTQRGINANFHRSASPEDYNHLGEYYENLVERLSSY